MRILVLGQGKTGKLVAEVAAERGHGVHVLDELANSAKMVIGTTGWYDKLADMRGLAERKQAGLLYGTNYSIGVQVMFKLAQQMGASLADAGYKFSIVETHHASKLDKPSGTAISIAEMVQRGATKDSGVPIESIREGDAKGLH